MKLKLLASLIILGSASSVCAQTTQRLVAAKSNDFGLVYSLPATQLQITIEAERTVRTPGEFYKYASRYLGTSEAIATPSEQWRIVSTHIRTVGVATSDAEQFLITLKSQNSPFLIVDKSGLPLALNTETLPSTPQTQALPVARAAAPTPLEGPDARRALTAEMIQSSSLAKKAEFAAARIMEIRSSRNDYLTGQADQMPDGQALEIIMKSLDAQEEALTAMFLGTEQTSTEVVTFNITPTAPVTNQVIARLSSTQGIVAADDLRGAPLYLSVDMIAEGKMPADEKGKVKEMPRGGLAYCIPGKARVSVSFDGRTLATIEPEMAQFGVVYGLDPALFTAKKNPSYVIFNPVTGGIAELGTVSVAD